MMVHQNARGAGLPNLIMQDATSRQVIEIQHHNTLRLSNGLLARLCILLENQEILSARHPFQKVGKIVGHNHLHFVPFTFKELSHSQNGADGVAVRVDVTGKDKAFRRLNYSIKAFEK